MTTPNGDRVTNKQLYETIGSLRLHFDKELADMEARLAGEIKERPTYKITGLLILVGVALSGVFNAAPSGVNTRAEAWLHAVTSLF